MKLLLSMVVALIAVLVASTNTQAQWNLLGYHAPGMNNPMVGYNAAGAADFYYGPRVIYVDRSGFSNDYVPVYQSVYRPYQTHRRYHRW